MASLGVPFSSGSRLREPSVLAGRMPLFSSSSISQARMSSPWLLAFAREGVLHFSGQATGIRLSFSLARPFHLAASSSCLAMRMAGVKTGLSGARPSWQAFSSMGGTGQKIRGASSRALAASSDRAASLPVSRRMAKISPAWAYNSHAVRGSSASRTGLGRMAPKIWHPFPEPGTTKLLQGAKQSAASSFSSLICRQTHLLFSKNGTTRPCGRTILPFSERESPLRASLPARQRAAGATSVSQARYASMAFSISSARRPHCRSSSHSFCASGSVQFARA